MTICVAAAAIIRHGRLLAARRTHPCDVAGGWELPGGKVDPGETADAAVVREIYEELGSEVEVLERLPGSAPIKPGYELTVHLARIVEGEPLPREHDALRWLGPEQLGTVDWLASDRPFLDGLRERLLDGTRLPGGNVGGAVRIGATVRRGTGAWTPAVHRLLDQLARSGLAEVPTVYGVDGRGREVLDYLPGRVPDIDTETPSEALLADAMGWLRRFHDAVRGVDLAGPWRLDGSGLDEGGTVICHHDFAPYNVSVGTSVSGERVVGVFDWDLAGPGTPLQELAFAAWNWVPLWRVMPADAAADRLRVMAAAYGAVEAADILARVVPRITAMVAFIRRGQADGDPGMVNLAEAGEPAQTQSSLDALRLRIPEIQSHLVRSNLSRRRGR
jgi:8-oxo-dGTP diphosphatase